MANASPGGQRDVKITKSNDLVSAELKTLNKNVGDIFGADAVFLRAPMRFGVDDAVRHEIEELRSLDQTHNKLVVILETTGGFIEVVERIYSVLRKHYEVVDFVVPNYAYSAGTVLVLSGDAIYMDYYSVLGPIDPQYENEAGELVPGMGYLSKYKELLAEINLAAAQTPPRTTDAELAYLIKKFDPAKLFAIEQACAHAESLLKAWLPKHKFKNWTVTETNQQAVTPEMREARASQIATTLGNPERWNSHGRGIGLRDLDSEEIKLKVNDFGQDADMVKAIRGYYELFVDFCGKLQLTAALHSQRGHRRV